MTAILPRVYKILPCILPPDARQDALCLALHVPPPRTTGARPSGLRLRSVHSPVPHLDSTRSHVQCLHAGTGKQRSPITCHVLNTTLGQPAAGLHVTLSRQCPESRCVLPFGPIATIVVDAVRSGCTNKQLDPNTHSLSSASLDEFH